MFGLIKGKLLAIGGAIIASLLAVIKFQSIRNSRIKNERDSAIADLTFKEDVIESDAEIDQEFSHRAEEAKRDKTKVPRNLRDPNDF